jgi:hypothetical protein
VCARARVLLCDIFFFTKKKGEFLKFRVLKTFFI